MNRTLDFRKGLCSAGMLIVFFALCGMDAHLLKPIYIQLKMTGLLDSSMPAGEMIIPPKFDGALEFSEGPSSRSTSEAFGDL